MSRRKNDAYFTPEDKVDFCMQSLMQNSQSMTVLHGLDLVTKANYGGAIPVNEIEYVLFIEPCAGAGNLTKALERYLAKNDIWQGNALVVSLDIDPKFAECGYSDFLTFEPSVKYLLALHNERPYLTQHQLDILTHAKCVHIHVITNPPYQILYQERWDGLNYRKSSKKVKLVDEIITCPPTCNVMARIQELIAYSQANREIPIEQSYLLRVTQLEPTGTNIVPLKTLASVYVLPRMSFTDDGNTDSATTAWFNWDSKRKSLKTECQIFAKDWS